MIVNSDCCLHQTLRCEKNYRFDEKLDTAMFDFIRADVFDENPVNEILNEYENPAKILDTNWYAIKPTDEEKYRELINDADNFFQSTISVYHVIG